MRKKLPFQSFMPLAALKSFVRVSALCFVLICTGTMTFGQAQLLKDINTLEQQSEGEYHHLTPASGIMYFATFGQLWKTTGTTGGTLKLKTFNSIRQIIPVGSSAYFIADDGAHGFELWKTAGTAASTVLVKDITPGSIGTEISSLTNVNGTVFFAAKTSLGKELWKTDGTAAGTLMVKDILKSSGSSNPTDLVNLNGTLYFSANDGTNGYELWKSNGTAAGTVMVKDIRPELKVSSSPQSLTVINNTIYFTAIRPETGRELWKTDGTEAGTVLIKDIFSGTSSSAALNLTM
jgi:trimeric autotransporter adhesin